MLREHLLVDGQQNVLLGHAEHDLGEVTSGTQINVEGTTLGVHASSEHDVLKDELVLKVVPIEYDFVINDLTDETERRLGAEAINCRHVEIIHEEDHVTASSWSQNLTRALVNVTLDDNLQSFRVSVGVEVHGGMDGLLWVKSGKVVLQNSGLASTCNTDVEYALVNGPMHIDKVVLSSSLGSWHDDVLEEIAEVSIEGCDLLVPWLVLKSGWAEVVIEYHSTLRELDLTH